MKPRTKEQYKEQIIQNLEKADLQELKIIDSLVRPFVDNPDGGVARKEAQISCIVYKLHCTELSEKYYMYLYEAIKRYSSYE